MRLIGSQTSPFVRKVRVILAERRIPCEFVEENVWAPETTVPRYNPLTKVPALELDGGESIYDSRVIAEYLDASSGGALIPADPLARAKARRLEALGDGIADAGILARLERGREPARQDPKWIDRQMDKVNAGIEAAARALGPAPYFGGAELDIADIACGCGLLWLEFRMPEIKWRERHAHLGAWAARLESRPAFATTRPPR
jgi:glutathione S-transferase